MILRKLSDKFIRFSVRVGFFTLSLNIFIYMPEAGSKADVDYYRAAVFEHVRFIDTSYPPTEIIEKNIKMYELAAKTAALNGADIIIFPEWGLFPHNKENRSALYDFVQDIPDPKERISNPCNERSLFQNRLTLRKLSCMAKDNSLYMVANLADVKKCQIVDTCDAHTSENCNSYNFGCPKDGRYIFNTNVVFDRDGNLIARYYKRHLYFEFDMNSPNLPEDIFFQTDFGNFTTVVCFDLMFEESVLAVEKSGVVNLAYPTFWFDHVPFVYFATPSQQAWAFTNKINLLAANVHYPATGTLGSGIYSAGRGALIYTHNPDGRSKLLLSNVPKTIDDAVVNSIPLDAKLFVIENGDPVESDIEEVKYFEKECLSNILGETNSTQSDYRCYPNKVGHYNFTKLKGNEGKVDMCSNNFCCYLSYKAENMEEDYFFGITGEPLNFYDMYTYGIQGCFLSRCESFDGQPCMNYLLKSNTIFHSVKIGGNFSTKYIFPFAVDSDVRLTDKKSWSFDRKSTLTYYNLNDNSLLFLGLYGRLFDLDKTIT